MTRAPAPWLGGIPRRTLLARGERIELGPAPWLMGIVNASPESFSDGAAIGDLDERVGRARDQLAAGAQLIDVGGESGVTNVPAIDPAEEIRRVVPLIEALVGELGARVSVDTYKPAVARAAVAAGAAVINDVSGLRDRELARVAAESGAALVIMHTRARPKTKHVDPSLDGRAFEDEREFLSERIGRARACGVAEEQIILDPGPDFGKTPAQSVEVLRRLGELHELGRPLLLPVSRKDFVGAITLRRPRERLAGTLAALAHGVRCGAHILRVHDVRDVADYLAVTAVLDGAAEVPGHGLLHEELRREPGEPLG